MNFKEAIESMHKGGKIRRNSWPHMIHLKLVKQDGLPDAVRAFRQESIEFQYDLSIFLSDDWLIAGETECVKFEEALLALQQRKTVKLKTWNDEYLEVPVGGNQLVMRRMIEYPYVPSFTCLNATDWEVLEI